MLIREAVSTIADLENKTMNFFPNLSRCRVSQHCAHSLPEELGGMKRLSPGHKDSMKVLDSFLKTHPFSREISVVFSFNLKGEKGKRKIFHLRNSLVEFHGFVSHSLGPGK